MDLNMDFNLFLIFHILFSKRGLCMWIAIAEDEAAVYNWRERDGEVEQNSRDLFDIYSHYFSFLSGSNLSMNVRIC